MTTKEYNDKFRVNLIEDLITIKLILYRFGFDEVCESNRLFTAFIDVLGIRTSSGTVITAQNYTRLLSTLTSEQLEKIRADIKDAD